ncbi:GyrI-like domain-containing protein [Providencia vermicola]|uniref:GyrI-like domain-containing protein n=1 Tax=Providencia vermicola TaxID=333965 RepID=A0AAX3RQX5_9GAMM|nr:MULTISPECIES: GyrI-like domain-containing protein [Providencia]ELX8378149.1 GyrI-like domain-containing protein [Providencia stuartii]EMD5258965.1 GyrI-like domain-containing protein [Providencia stuartii]USB36121.1 GyrI-like domain-containing protein [Providencia vermicola]WFC05047.1 GyrI-like domain-containing protein [Providencia vermicola]
MNLTDCGHKHLLGITIRTRNENERSRETAQIPGLWKTFYEEIYKKVLNGETVYGVYSGYESDHAGYFDVSAAVEKVGNEVEQKDVKPIVLQSGKYLKFTSKSEGDNQIWQLWEQVWEFFSDENQELERAYTTDYEVFYPNKEVELYIAIK